MIYLLNKCQNYVYMIVIISYDNNILINTFPFAKFNYQNQYKGNVFIYMKKHVAIDHCRNFRTSLRKMEKGPRQQILNISRNSMTHENI